MTNPPEREDYDCEADYIDAIVEYTRSRLTPEELAIKREYIVGLIQLENLLADEAD